MICSLVIIYNELATLPRVLVESLVTVHEFVNSILSLDSVDRIRLAVVYVFTCRVSLDQVVIVKGVPSPEPPALRVLSKRVTVLRVIDRSVHVEPNLRVSVPVGVTHRELVEDTAARKEGPRDVFTDVDRVQCNEVKRVYAVSLVDMPLELRVSLEVIDLLSPRVTDNRYPHLVHRVLRCGMEFMCEKLVNGQLFTRYTVNYKNVGLTLEQGL